MSVAFRRESDDEHKEPKFEWPIPAGPNLVTKRGLRMISEKLEALKTELAGATDERREHLQRDLRYWKTRHATAVVAPVPGTDAVAVGSRVTLRIGGKTRAFDIVGGDEADPNAGKIAFTSPIAKAVMEAEVGEVVPFNGKENGIEVLATVPVPE